MRKAIVMALVVAGIAWAQQKKRARPDFKDYAVDQVYTGAPAAPIITPNWRSFRTRIREGAKSKVQFAGHYTLAVWGCGAGCVAFVIVDSISGRIYDGFTVALMPFKWEEKHGFHAQLEFHPKSRLFKVTGCPGETNCGFYDYEMVDDKGLELIGKELLPKEFQY